MKTWWEQWLRRSDEWRNDIGRDREVLDEAAAGLAR